MSQKKISISDLEIKLAEEKDLKGIQALLEANHKSKLSKEEKESYGFITYRPGLEELNRINNELGIVVAKERETVAGYLILMSKEYAEKDQFFKEFIDKAKQMTYKGQRLSDINYMVFAQICVAKEYRGQKLSHRLYDLVDRIYEGEYDIGIAEIDSRNKISLYSAKKVGYAVAGSYHSNGVEWYVVVKKLNKNKLR